MFGLQNKSFRIKSKVLAMNFFDLFDYFSISLLRFFFGWVDSIDLLVRYSGSGFHSILWIVIQDMSCCFFISSCLSMTLATSISLNSAAWELKFVCVTSFVLLLGRLRDLPH